MRRLNLDGDQQADLTVHGGISKAVYAYPSEHYGYWRTELPAMDLCWGMFGENFTTDGLLENAVYIGDRFQIGETEVMATEPRMPCYKLGIKFGRADIIKRFLASRRTGFYFAVMREGLVGAGDTVELIRREQEEISVADITAVMREGLVGAGDTVELIRREQEEISVADITSLYAFDKDDVKSLRRAIQVEALPESWKGYFQHQLEKQARQ